MDGEEKILSENFEAKEPNCDAKNESENISPAMKESSQEQIIGKPGIIDQTSDIQKSEIENMEVHHHPKVEKKNFREYFLEFVMLFLAVTLGFFAENVRENFTDREREKQYMESMIEDLKSDTSQMAVLIQAKQLRNRMIDSLVFFLGSPGYNAHSNDIYFFARSISPPLNFFPNERTIQQLKSSGGLRLIRNINVSNSIMEYDQKMMIQLSDIGDEQNLRLEYRKSVRNLFNGKVFMSMLNDNSLIEKPLNNPPLFKADETNINNLIVDVQYVKKADQIQVERYEELVKQAINLIQLIQKEYHLNNE
jgi:hypothetical protein